MRRVSTLSQFRIPPCYFYARMFSRSIALMTWKWLGFFIGIACPKKNSCTIIAQTRTECKIKGSNRKWTQLTNENTREKAQKCCCFAGFRFIFSFFACLVDGHLPLFLLLLLGPNKKKKVKSSDRTLIRSAARCSMWISFHTRDQFAFAYVQPTYTHVKVKAFNRLPSYKL